MKQDCSMDTATDLLDERKPERRCSPKSAVQLWLPGVPVLLCLLMSLSSVTVCLLMTSKTYELETRLQMEANKAPVSETPRVVFVDDEGSLIPELAAPVGQLVEQKVEVLMPKFRTARDVGQECVCPPGTCHAATRGPLTPTRKGRRSKADFLNSKRTCVFPEWRIIRSSRSSRVQV
ncbi:unnamed protein product [Tetraodon nigroviridis]|uniref:Chromosome 1 SCAF14632, whole genome shotgun sequence n=1 Tax=Tetraodon nigroviridis TaxID=99883 RepID=Q4SDT1_TETNG|nr:unnamed protein product [Tetraodon nigroviridis]